MRGLIRAHPDDPARDADKLEMLLQAREYEDQGHRDVRPWIDSALSRLRTDAGRQLAAEALAQPPLDWIEHARPELPAP